MPLDPYYTHMMGKDFARRQARRDAETDWVVNGGTEE
jgi:hypothetical protein